MFKIAVDAEERFGGPLMVWWDGRARRACWRTRAKPSSWSARRARPLWPTSPGTGGTTRPAASFAPSPPNCTPRERGRRPNLSRSTAGSGAWSPPRRRMAASWPFPQRRPARRSPTLQMSGCCTAISTTATCSTSAGSAAGDRPQAPRRGARIRLRQPLLQSGPRDGDGARPLRPARGGRVRGGGPGTPAPAPVGAGLGGPFGGLAPSRRRAAWNRLGRGRAGRRGTGSLRAPPPSVPPQDLR